MFLSSKCFALLWSFPPETVLHVSTEYSRIREARSLSGPNVSLFQQDPNLSWAKYESLMQADLYRVAGEHGGGKGREKGWKRRGEMEREGKRGDKKGKLFEKGKREKKGENKKDKKFKKGEKRKKRRREGERGKTWKNKNRKKGRKKVQKNRAKNLYGLTRRRETLSNSDHAPGLEKKKHWTDWPQTRGVCLRTTTCPMGRPARQATPWDRLVAASTLCPTAAAPHACRDTTPRNTAFWQPVLAGERIPFVDNLQENTTTKQNAV